MTLSVNLGPRLQTVASLVPEGAKLGDIGTDHAYLPIALCETQQISKAVAIDVHEGPYRSACAAVQQRHLDNVINVRMGDGLMPLYSGEVDALTLAGMGGRTMLDILSARPDILNSVTDLVVQPQGGEGLVRLTLLADRWLLKAEQLVEEEGRVYVVMAYSRNEGLDYAQLLEKERLWKKRLESLREKGIIVAAEPEFSSLVHKLVWYFGPLLLQEPTDLLQRSLKDYELRLAKRLEQMKRSNSTEIRAKIRDAADEMALVEGLRTWQ